MSKKAELHKKMKWPRKTLTNLLRTTTHIQQGLHGMEAHNHQTVYSHPRHRHGRLSPRRIMEVWMVVQRLLGGVALPSLLLMPMAVGSGDIRWQRAILGAVESWIAIHVGLSCISKEIRHHDYHFSGSFGRIIVLLLLLLMLLAPKSHSCLTTHEMMRAPWISNGIKAQIWIRSWASRTFASCNDDSY
jgi:hypothetical protein